LAAIDEQLAHRRPFLELNLGLPIIGAFIVELQIELASGEIFQLGLLAKVRQKTLYS